MTARHVIAAALMLLASAALAQLTGEIPLSQPQYGPVALTNGVIPFAASDGTNFLVAWLDYRGLGPQAIYATRVTRSGEILDRTGIRLPNDPAKPAAAPTQILGLFHVDGAYTLFYLHGVSPVATYAVIISDDGQILDGPRQVFNHSTGLMASNGSRIVASNGTDLFVLNAHAEIINHVQTPVITGTYGYALASNGSTFLLMTFVRAGATSSANLMALDSGGQPGSVTRINTSFSPSLQSDGAGYLFLHNEGNGTLALSISADGVPGATTTIDLSQYYRLNAVAWTGLEYVFVAPTPRLGTVYLVAARLNRAGSPIGETAILETGTSSSDGAAAGNGQETLFAWISGIASVTGLSVHAAVVDADGRPVSPVLTLPTTSNAQARPAMATVGVYDLAVWEEATCIYATRVTPGGAALDGRGIAVYAQKPGAQGALRPRVVFDGKSYLVVWGSATLTGQRIDPATGSLLDAPTLLASCARSFDLGYDGTSPVVFVAGCDPQLYAQRVDSIGATGPRVPIFPVGTPLSQPRAAWSGQEWVVVWQESRGGTNAYFGRLSRDLTVLETSPILDDPAPPFDDEAPQVASSGHDVVVGVTRVGSRSGVYCRHIHGDGTVDDSTLLAPNASNGSLAWDGTQYAVLYTETCATPCQARSYLSHIGLQEEGPVLLDKVPIGESSVLDGTLASGNGRVRIVYTRNALEPLYGGSPRVFLRDDFVTVPRRHAIGRR